MKFTASLVTKSILAIGIAASVVACNQNKTADKPAAASSTPATAASTTGDKPEIVYFNQDSVVSQYNYIKDMDKRLEAKGKAAQSDVGSRQQAIQREIADYQKNAATMSADQRAATEQRLQRKGQEFQQYQQNAGAAVQNDQMNEQTKLYEKLSDFVKTYAKEHGYKLVLTYKKGDPTMMYGDPSLDITADVVKGLNDAYAKDKK
ncbi:OmpH family outer membrane protein [Mucilaginibacter achroorhodeus]|uniref:OmpH family outer membrane protein n=1 Tax=Mucilaginibacter achroorhodeus TaxID=2599294 RepID=A0A563U9P1_9SPHI|nr:MULTISPECIES: OmpH family outer membrane protein [Mucilaginibacter]QXV67035.1 OmpH family outer membrane protein [Mucilaginibacter sp. 21P]TWR27989.1 OmpH family outer membrane protein [Mucilaginibacter achroorhodeus]